MNRLRALIRSFFAFSRKETNAFLILVPLMVLIIFSEPLFQLFQKAPQWSEDTRVLDSLIATWEWSNGKEDEAAPSGIDIQYFRFDPNQATNGELQLLGIPSYLSQRIINYRSNGGQFRTKSDLLKIYGLDSSLYNQLSSFVDLPDALEAISVRPERMVDIPLESVYDLNMADSMQLMDVRGIGRILARRIMSYRQLLGGFVSEDQLMEVYGLDSLVVFELMNTFDVQPDFRPRLINVNTATERELSVHPYIPTGLAKAIITYRFQHGSFDSETALRNVATIDEKTFLKIKPYLTFDQ